MMQFYSTNNVNLRVNLKEAVFKSLPDDNGLYMPVETPELPTNFIQNLSRYSFQEISYIVAKNLLQGSIPDKDLEEIIQKAIDFPAPVVRLDEKTYVLELFHGPSLSFKDFGARFMAQVMAWLNRGENQKITILVATSGDTGAAVAAGFYQTPDTEVIILYPSGKVSPLQEKQLTTLGLNITALEINGTFDDCQALVKKVFLDPEVTEKIRLSSANSINIARLIPQSFYYFEAFKQVTQGQKIVFSVPSGNFGNLTAGLLAKKMGLPVHHFIAATNVNDVVPEYLQTGTYKPRLSIRTLSNAMDVGAPSNFARMLDVYGSTWNIIKTGISGFGFTDEETRTGMREINARYDYTIDPHGAVGYLALQEYQKQEDSVGIIFETAHPSKFAGDVEKTLGKSIEIPERLARLNALEKRAVLLSTRYQDFKGWLLSSHS